MVLGGPQALGGGLVVSPTPTLGMGGHQTDGRGSKRGGTDEWLTPPEIIRALGTFDLDPCAPIQRPWPTARKHFTIDDDGMFHPWNGRVWLNPPYGSLQSRRWLRRLAHHGDGIALIFARTETDWFHETVWNKAHALLFLKGRIHFHLPTGERSQYNSGAPSVLVAYGYHNVESLVDSGIKGKVVRLR